MATFSGEAAQDVEVGDLRGENHRGPSPTVKRQGDLTDRVRAIRRAGVASYPVLVDGGNDR